MKNYIVFYDDWTDEMDICGFFTCNSEYKKKLTKKLKKYKEEYTFCIGTNEEIYYENGKAILDSLIFKEISKKELKVLSKVFNSDEEETDEEIIERVIRDKLYGKHFTSDDDLDMEIGDYTKVSENFEKDVKKTLKSLTKEDSDLILEKSKKDENDEIVYDNFMYENEEYDNSEEEIEETLGKLSDEEYKKLLKKENFGEVEYGFNPLEYFEYEEEEDEL